MDQKNKALELLWRVRIKDNVQASGSDSEEAFAIVKDSLIYPYNDEFCAVYDAELGWFLYWAQGLRVIRVEECGDLMPSPNKGDS